MPHQSLVYLVLVDHSEKALASVSRALLPMWSASTGIDFLLKNRYSDIKGFPRCYLCITIPDKVFAYECGQPDEPDPGGKVPQ
jgi:hypothetical protein